MEGVKRAARVAAVFCLANLLLLFGELIVLPGWLTAVVLGGLALFYVSFHIRPRWEQAATPGCGPCWGDTSCWWWPFGPSWPRGCSTGCSTSPVPWRPWPPPPPGRWMVPVVGALVYVPVILLLLVNGFFRVLFTCNRLRVCGGCCCSSPGGCRCSTSTSSTGC